MKKINLLTLAVLTSISLSAQWRGNENPRHELSVSLGGGFSSLSYKLTQGTANSELGTSCGIGYRYNFNDNWSINTGAEYALYNNTASSVTFENITYGLNDGEGNRYDLYSQVSGFKEKQRVTFLTIPFLAGFQVGEDFKLFVNAGLKVAIPLNATYASEQEISLNNRGYFPDKENWAIDQKFMGFGRFEVEEGKGNLKLNTAYLASVEAGLKWTLTDNLFLYTGLYFDYGLNDIVSKHAERPFIIAVPSEEEGYTYTSGSILTGTISPEGENITFSDKVIPFAVGLKIRLAWGFGE